MTIPNALSFLRLKYATAATGSSIYFDLATMSAELNSTSIMASFPSFLATSLVTIGAQDQLGQYANSPASDVPFLSTDDPSYKVGLITFGSVESSLSSVRSQLSTQYSAWASKYDLTACNAIISLAPALSTYNGLK